MPISTYFTGSTEQRLSDDLHLAGVAERTRKGYLRAVRQLAEHAKCSPNKIDKEQLRQWLLHLKVDKQFAYGSLRVAFQASSSSSLAPVNETGKRSPKLPKVDVLHQFVLFLFREEKGNRPV